MRVGLTYDLREDWVWKDSDPKDANAEFDKPATIEQLTTALASEGHDVVPIGNVHSLIRKLPDLDVDIVFNICEGLRGRNRESQVPILLEMNDVPYVGSDALTLGLTLDKSLAKKCFRADRIPTPRFFVARHADDLEGLDRIGFPLIVKTCYEGTSKGLTDQSRVDNITQLKQQVDFITRTYQQPALVEEFIPGMEFTVAVLGNGPYEPMPVVQVCIDGKVDLGDLFYTFDYVTSSSLRYICPPKIPAQLDEALKDLAVRTCRSVGCRDFGRVDFRVDARMQPQVLEINPLPCLGHEDIFNIFPQVIGSTYNRTINRILQIAGERCGWNGGAARRPASLGAKN